MGNPARGRTGAEMIEFFLPVVPLRTTAQQAKIAVINGKPHKYMPQELANAKELYLAHLSQHVPKVPLDGPLALRVDWYFQTKTKKLDGNWKITSPDTDNLNKLFKDCMTECGYWHDDAQVVYEVITKRWSVTPGIKVIVSLLGPSGLLGR